MNYTIYHVPGQKVGCTSDFDRRKREYWREGLEPVVIETLECSAKEAGDREWHWAEFYGYRKGQHYTRWTTEKVKTYLKGVDHEARAKKSMQTMGPEGLKQRAQKTARQMTDEQRLARNAKIAATWARRKLGEFV